MFVEGSEDSLDKPLYSLIFPMVSVVPKQSCKAVEEAVSGLRAADSLTWVHAWGVVDGDGQSSERIADLTGSGIFAIPFYSVESIYYHPWILARIAARLSRITSADPITSKDAAIDAGINWVRQRLTNMVIKAATRAARDALLSALPTVPTVTAGEVISVNIDTGALVADKVAQLQARLEARDWEAIVTTCPVRESVALEPMCKAIGFPCRRDYEAAVRTMLMDDPEALTFVRNMFAGAFEAVSAVAA